jgi:TetR/AcrR family transcriptional regulator, regulator of cefoperazone and chloramphenicol sensitivity
MVSQVLLDVAIDQFGRLGFEGASTREIARASGTAMSSITYHFGGKQGLYLAAAAHIGERIQAMQGEPARAALATVGETREAAAAALAGLLDNIAQMMLDPETENWARFIVREQQAPTEAFDRLFDGAMRPVLEVFVALIGRARPDLSPPDCIAMSILLFGQATVMRAARAAITRSFGVAQIDDAIAARLRAQLRANVHSILMETPR